MKYEERYELFANEEALFFELPKPSPIFVTILGN